MKRLTLALAAMFLLAALAVPAAEGGGDSALREKLADELLAAMNMEKNFADSIEKMVDVQTSQNPMMKELREPMLEFFRKYMSYESMRVEMVKLYAAEFAAGELRDLIAFYNTPTGKKAADKMPVLMQKGAEVGMRRVQQNQAELQKIVMEHIQKNRPQPGQGPQ
jgi:hypothetical protein